MSMITSAAPAKEWGVESLRQSREARRRLLDDNAGQRQRGKFKRIASDPENSPDQKQFDYIISAIYSIRSICWASSNVSAVAAIKTRVLSSIPKLLMAAVLGIAQA